MDGVEAVEEVGGPGGEEAGVEEVEEGAPTGKGGSCGTCSRGSWSEGGEDLQRKNNKGFVRIMCKTRHNLSQLHLT